MPTRGLCRNASASATSSAIARSGCRRGRRERGACSSPRCSACSRVPARPRPACHCHQELRAARTLRSTVGCTVASTTQAGAGTRLVPWSWMRRNSQTPTVQPLTSRTRGLLVRLQHCPPRGAHARTSLAELKRDDAPPRPLVGRRRGWQRAWCSHHCTVAWSRMPSTGAVLPGAYQVHPGASIQQRAARACRRRGLQRRAPPCKLVTPGAGRLHHAAGHAGGRPGRAAPVQGAPHVRPHVS
jgi:hypothetical protein